MNIFSIKKVQTRCNCTIRLFVSVLFLLLLYDKVLDKYILIENLIIQICSCVMDVFLEFANSEGARGRRELKLNGREKTKKNNYKKSK